MHQKQISLKAAKKKAALSLQWMLIKVEPQRIEAIAQSIRKQFNLDVNYRKNLSTSTSYIPIIPEHTKNYWWFEISKGNACHLDGDNTYISVCKSTSAVVYYTIN